MKSFQYFGFSPCHWAERGKQRARKHPLVRQHTSRPNRVLSPAPAGGTAWKSSVSFYKQDTTNTPHRKSEEFTMTTTAVTTTKLPTRHYCYWRPEGTKYSCSCFKHYKTSHFPTPDCNCTLTEQQRVPNFQTQKISESLLDHVDSVKYSVFYFMPSFNTRLYWQAICSNFSL